MAGELVILSKKLRDVIIGDIQQAKMHISFCDLRSGNFSTLFFYSIEGAAWL